MTARLFNPLRAGVKGLAHAGLAFFLLYGPSSAAAQSRSPAPEEWQLWPPEDWQDAENAQRLRQRAGSEALRTLEERHRAEARARLQAERKQAERAAAERRRQEKRRWEKR